MNLPLLISSHGLPIFCCIYYFSILLRRKQSMLIAAIIILVIVALILFEYRIRKPDQIVLYESAGIVKRRRSKFYPRHFSQAVSGTTYAFSQKIETEAKGKLPIVVRLALAVAASTEHLSELIRAGGWRSDAVARATGELEVLIHSFVGDFCGKYEIEELKSESLGGYLDEKLRPAVTVFGLDILSLTVQAIDPADDKIAEAMRKREASRILEQTEQEEQRARVAATKARIEADDKISMSEHTLQLKKLELRETEQKREDILATMRMKEELKRREMQFDFDRRELDLLKKNPELLILSPQLTRLAEASQNLKNAKTVVNLSSSDAAQGVHLVALFQNLLKNILTGAAPKAESDK